jgi:hypothetical protein
MSSKKPESTTSAGFGVRSRNAMVNIGNKRHGRNPVLMADMNPKTPPIVAERKI